MKFDFVIGNPPYQEPKDKTSDKPIYNYFMDAAYEISDRVELITPARFLFNAGKTPESWNKKMLEDEHFKVLSYTANSKEVFSNTDIKGGVAITYRDSRKNFGKIDTFIPVKELNSIFRKIHRNNFESLSKIIYSSSSYRFSEAFYKEQREASNKLSNSGKRFLTSNVFDLLFGLIFFDSPQDSDDWIKIIGRENGKRTIKYMKRKYIQPHENLNHYKVFVPNSNGSRAIGGQLSTPVIGAPVMGTPVMGATQTFISIGKFESKLEAENALKYVKTKFARCLLSILKSTQHNPPDTWEYVPLQDFTNESDIDWSASIPNIDKQLYKKYGLSEDEINFIEEKVQAMK